VAKAQLAGLAVPVAAAGYAVSAITVRAGAQRQHPGHGVLLMLMMTGAGALGRLTGFLP
jgi:hypothetical protein